MNHSIDRRDFLHGSATFTGALSCAPLIGGVFDSLPANDDRVLVVLQLSGGNDYLNTVVPMDNDDYHRARRVLRKKNADCLKIADGVGFNKELAALKELYDDGSLAVLQGIGYPNPNRSHFKSMDIWHSAEANDRPKKDGWLGKFASRMTKVQEDADFCINLAAQPPLALHGSSYQPISFQNPNAFRANYSKDQAKALERLAKAEADGSDLLSLLGKTAANARASSRAVREAAQSYRTPVRYERSQISNNLKTVAALLKAGLSTRVYYVYHNGFDTHVNQQFRHDRLLQQFSAAVGSFQKDLARLGLKDRVVTMVFSEFGRRVKENGSRGTDHGAAGAGFVIGSPVKGGLYGKQPDLRDLDRGDVKHSVDFRRVYATLLREWFKTDPRPILGNQYESLPLL